MRSRFEHFCNRDGGLSACHLWTGSTRRGYGRFYAGPKARNARAHRVALELSLGVPIPSGLVVMHKCDNRRCVNPLHLKVGTQRDNILDMMRKGRGGPPSGSDNGRSKLNHEAAKVLRHMRGVRPIMTLARLYGVDKMQVWRIWTGSRWRVDDSHNHPAPGR